MCNKMGPSYSYHSDRDFERLDSKPLWHEEELSVRYEHDATRIELESQNV